jgi:hypothetical protein
MVELMPRVMAISADVRSTGGEKSQHGQTKQHGTHHVEPTGRRTALWFLAGVGELEGFTAEMNAAELATAGVHVDELAAAGTRDALRLRIRLAAVILEPVDMLVGHDDLAVDTLP